MNLIDLALKFNDFQWAEELVNNDEVIEALEGELGKTTIFNKEAPALEKITTQYGVKEKNGVRAFNINSEFDRNEAELVLVEESSYSIGDTVKYYIPSRDELTYIRGNVNGFVMGYREALKDVNLQYNLLRRKIDETLQPKPGGAVKKKNTGQKRNARNKEQKENKEKKPETISEKEAI
ncbi:MAG: hypothetical protein N2484_05700 [Clostridia bacterium]|nr:hypothetical protein [Clostridia bacterium]